MIWSWSSLVVECDVELVFELGGERFAGLVVSPRKPPASARALKVVFTFQLLFRIDGGNQFAEIVCVGFDKNLIVVLI